MRYRLTVALGYFALMTVFIYGEMDTGRTDIWLAALVVLAQFTLGFVLNRWWAAILPLALVLIAIPAGYPPITPSNAEPFPIFFGVAFGAVFSVPLVLFGVIARRVAAPWLPSRNERGSRNVLGSDSSAADPRTLR